MSSSSDSPTSIVATSATTTNRTSIRDHGLRTRRTTTPRRMTAGIAHSQAASTVGENEKASASRPVAARNATRTAVMIPTGISTPLRRFGSLSAIAL